MSFPRAVAGAIGIGILYQVLVLQLPDRDRARAVRALHSSQLRRPRRRSRLPRSSASTASARGGQAGAPHLAGGVGGAARGHADDGARSQPGDDDPRGLLAPGSDGTATVVAQLGDRERIRKARVHPIVLAALRTYAPVAASAVEASGRRSARSSTRSTPRSTRRSRTSSRRASGCCSRSTSRAR